MSLFAPGFVDLDAFFDGFDEHLVGFFDRTDVKDAALQLGAAFAVRLFEVFGVGGE